VSKKKKIEEEDRRYYRAKIKCPHLLRSAAINMDAKMKD